MKFSAQEEYGLRCLLAIGRSPDGSATIPEISRRECLSESHVAKLLMILRKEGFVESSRGHSGGYALSRPAEQIVIGDVLAALGGRLFDENYCSKHRGLGEACVHGSDCAISGLWNSIQESVDRVTYAMSLRCLLDPSKEPATIRLRPGMPAQVRKRVASRMEA